MERRLLSLVTSALLFLGAAGIGWAQRQETIDFEGLEAGTVLSEVQACGATVTVDGFNEAFGLRPNAAIIFDTAEPTGEDEDLASPNETCRGGGPGIGAAGQRGREFENCPAEPLGKVLIIAENLTDANNDDLIDDPDDEGTGANNPQYTFDFSAAGSVTTVSIDLLDTEEPGPSVQLFDAENNMLSFFELPSTGDNGWAEAESLGPTSGVATMVLVLNGSGALNDLIIVCDPQPDGARGCMTRYWKNRLDSWVAAGYSPTQSVESVFAEAAEFPRLARKRLRRALGLGGGKGRAGGAKMLLREAVASLLNAAHPDVAFPRSERAVLAAVSDALASGDRQTMVDLAAELAADNSWGCPLN